MKAPLDLLPPKNDLEYFYVQLLEYAADWVRTRSREREPAGILKDLVVPGPIEGGISLRYKPKLARGGQPIRSGRFFYDPNQVAAALAAECVEDWRGTDVGSKRHGSYKLRSADGSMNIHDAAARFAVKLVNEHYVPLLARDRRRREADHASVMELLRRSRAHWPSVEIS
jgi:hypothetical protein